MTLQSALPGMPGIMQNADLKAAVLHSICSRLPAVIAVYAFGSQVQDTANPDSDLDLAVLVAGYADPLTLWELAGSLADIVGCPVDLLDFRSASTVMQYQILMTGLRIWAQEPAAGLYECFVLSEKTALDTARAGILADIQERGAVYGR